MLATWRDFIRAFALASPAALVQGARPAWFTLTGWEATKSWLAHASPFEGEEDCGRRRPFWECAALSALSLWRDGRPSDLPPIVIPSDEGTQDFGDPPGTLDAQSSGSPLSRG